MKKELINRNIPLIDRYVVSGFYLTPSDNNISQFDNVSLSTYHKKIKYSRTVFGIPNFNSLEINFTEYDHNATGLNYLKFKVNTHNGTFITELDISVPPTVWLNLNGQSIDEIEKQLNKIQNYLFQVYKLHIDFSTAEFKYIEIQRTIELNNNYDEYTRCLDNLLYFIPRNAHFTESKYNINGSYKKLSDYKKTTLSVYEKNKSEEIIIYNKTEQLNQKVRPQIERQYLRFEIKLKSKKQIKKYLHTASITELTIDDIINCYMIKFKKYILGPYTNSIKFSKAYAIDLINTYLLPRKYNKVLHLLMRIYEDEAKAKFPIIVNISAITEALDLPSIKKEITGPNRSKYKRDLRSFTSTSELCEGKSELLDELIDKLSLKEDRHE